MACATLAAVLLGGCDPCAGIADCIGEPRIAVEGRIVETVSGAGVAGVEVTVVRLDADSVALDSATAVTDSRGDYRLTMPAPGSAGDVKVDIAVHPPDEGPGYRVRGLTLRVDRRLGEAQVLEPWVDRPFYAVAGEAWALEDPTGRTKLTGDFLEFHRTGGAELGGPGWDGGPVAMQTDKSGRFALLGRLVTTEELEPVTGRLALVRHGERGFTGEIRLHPSYEFHPTSEVLIVRMGANFPYLGETRMNDTSVAGVRVDFRLVSGVPGLPETFTVVSGAGGLFSLAAYRPGGLGDVTFDLTFTPPPPLAPFTKRVTLPVFAGHSFGERFARFHVDRPAAAPEPFS